MRYILLVILVAIFVAACGSTDPQTASPEAARAFYVGLAALQVGDDPRAKDELTKATQLAPNEPAAWANLGILQMRHKDFEASARSLERARTLADKNPKIYETIAMLEKQRGNFEAVQGNLQKAIELDPNNVKAMYALAEEKERLTDDSAALGLYDRILAVKPDNVAAKIDVLRLAAKQGGQETVRRVLSELSGFEHGESEVRIQYIAVATAFGSGDLTEVARQTAFLRNILVRHPFFRHAIAEVKYPDTSIGEPFQEPLVLQVPDSSAASPDTLISFEPRTTKEADESWSKFIYLDNEKGPVNVAGNGSRVAVGENDIPFAVETPAGIVSLDFDYDFQNDIALAGTRGFRLYRQEASTFHDVTEQTKLSPAVPTASYSGVWTFDVESDGDLDLLLARQKDAPTVLQNNSDGTFVKIDTFATVPSIRQFAAADLDEDGDADAVFLTTDGDLQFFSNERGGLFKKLDIPVPQTKATDFVIADAVTDGRLEIVTLQSDGVIRTISHERSGSWNAVELIQDEPVMTASSIKIADLDNNGGADVIVANASESWIYLAITPGWFAKLERRLPGNVSSIADIDGDGRLDLAVAGDGKAGFLANKGSKNYNWQSVRPRAAKTTGDQRVNSFGIGGELELRAGLSVQKRLITEPVVHFGLGEQPAADVLRVVWQNGFVQAEFDLKPNQTIAAEQRLKGSCPHLFAFDGEKFRFVKDAAPWSPALGLKINAVETFGIIETEEWFKIPGDALKPTADNFYELRITGEYWESFYLDQYSLLVVDHPANTEIFTDERFAIPPAPLEVFTTGRTREFAAVRGSHAQDVSSIVRALDEKYLDDFDRGTFQGVAADHYVEVELPSDAPSDKRIAIVADGWVHPTDASINVQLGQSSREKPRSLSLEVRDANGEWKVAKENLGLPAGKMKTVLIELPVGSRAARLRTNMEIFWDKLAWAVYENAAANKTTRLELAASDLRYRGFSVIEKRDDSSPEIPIYDRLLTTTQRWRDMEGHFTRFGDVRELLVQTDDRYVLANAGDEIVLKFPAMPPPPDGYKRDFVLIGNGWIKDGDLNSVFSKTLLPLPMHSTNDYSRAPTTLENDPVFQKHKADWINFHTRYVAPDAFRNALR